MAIDINKWLNDNVTALNLSDEEKALAQKLASGEFGKRLGASVYPQQSVSDLQSALDKEKAQKKEVEEANLLWQEAYYKDVSELGGIDRLARAGFDVTGLQATRGGGAADPNTGQSLTAAEIEKLIERKASELIDPVRQTSLEFAEFIAGAAADYREAYGKRFDAPAFRKYAFEHRTEFANMQQAYDSFTADDRKAKDEDTRKKWESDKEKEIEMRIMSRMQIPEFSPESGAGGPFDIATKASNTAAAAAAAGSGNAPAPTATREQNRQEFAKQFNNLDLRGL